jgi:hypothetical protein
MALEFRSVGLRFIKDKIADPEEVYATVMSRRAPSQQEQQSRLISSSMQVGWHESTN